MVLDVVGRVPVGNTTVSGPARPTSVNSLGNRKFVDGVFEDGKLVLIQKGKLFRNRQGQHRLTFFNITADRFELALDSCDEKTDSWSVGGYGYVATRATA